MQIGLPYLNLGLKNMKPNQTKYFVDASGNYLGGYDGAEPPLGAIEIPTPPNHGLDRWDGERWIAYQPPVSALIAETDKDMARVAEDLVVALATASRLPITLPQEAIDKVNARLILRGRSPL